LNSQPKPLYFRDCRRKIDYILAYQEHPDKPADWQEKRKDKREFFEKNLKEHGLELEQEDFEVSLKFCFDQLLVKHFLGIKLYLYWIALSVDRAGKKFSSWEHNLETRISCRPTEYFCAKSACA
jgi:hypothetical protein